MSQSNKSAAKSLKKALKELGHDIPLQGVYEILAKASGYHNWNTASAKSVELAEVLKSQPVDGKTLFKVTATAKAEIEKTYEVYAESQEEAENIVQQKYLSPHAIKKESSGWSVTEFDIPLLPPLGFKPGWVELHSQSHAEKLKEHDRAIKFLVQKAGTVTIEIMNAAGAVGQKKRNEFWPYTDSLIQQVEKVNLPRFSGHRNMI